MFVWFQYNVCVISIQCVISVQCLCDFSTMCDFSSVSVISIQCLCDFSTMLVHASYHVNWGKCKQAPHTSESNCGFFIHEYKYLYSICCNLMVQLHATYNKRKTFHSVFLHEWRHKLQETSRKESWSVSIYYTRASSCVNKLGYLHNTEGGRYDYSRCSGSRLSRCVFSMGTSPCYLWKDYAWQTRLCVHKKKNRGQQEVVFACQCVKTKIQQQ